jgi:hypothetical protein
MNAHEIRGKLVRQYAWAVPTDEAILTLREYLPLIEIGAGKGYWASLIDGDILCFDCHAKNPEVNTYVDGGEPFHKVLRGGADRVAEHPNRTLFLCWPPYDTEMGGDCLRAYTGDVFIHVGEWSGGCTGGSCYWKQIREEWDEVKTISLPQWSGMHDDMTIFKRKG